MSPLYEVAASAHATGMISVCPKCGAQNRLPAGRLNQRASCGHCQESLSPPHRPIEVRSASDFSELIKDAPLPVLVDFWADWCAPCRMVAPELVKIAGEKEDHLIVAKVNTEALPEVAGRFDIDAIPTMILFEHGKESQRLSGAQPASGILRELGL